MIDFSEETYEAILSRQLQRVTDSLDKREGSIIQTALGPESWYIAGLYLTLTQMQENSFALFAVGQYLDYKVAERGLSRNQATPAKRLGIFDASVNLGDRFSTIAGKNSLIFYVTKNLGLIDGYYNYELTCETSGIVGNDYTGELLPITYVPDLTIAQLTTIIDDGTNEEDDESLRTRYIDSLRDQPFAGNIAAYRQEILSQDEVGAVQIYPVWQGGGTVKCSILNANYDSASDDLISRIQYYICPPEATDTNPSANGYGFAPIGSKVTISTATELVVDISMTVQVLAGYTIELITPQINETIDNYLLSVRRTWGAAITTTKIEYPVWVYISQLTAAIIAIDGVVNVTNVLLNNQPNDLKMVENGETQQIPIKGQVTING